MRFVIPLFCLSVAALSAQTPAAPNNLRYVQTYDDVRSTLGLTDAQLNDLRQLQQDRMTATQAYYQKANEKQKELTSLLEGGSTDAAKIGQAMLDVQAMRKIPPPGMSDTHEKAIALLTAEQKTKLKKLEESMALRGAADQAMQLGLLNPPTAPTPKVVSPPRTMAPTAAPPVKH